MIGADTYRYIALFRTRLFIADASGQSAYLVTQRFDGVDIKNRSDLLNSYGKTLQTHAGIDVLLHKVAVISMAVIVELGEYDVPYFHETVAFAAHDILRSVAEFRSSVVIDLRAGAARTRTMLPEVVLFAELIDALSRHMHVVQPDIVGLIIVHID